LHLIKDQKRQTEAADSETQEDLFMEAEELDMVQPSLFSLGRQAEYTGESREDAQQFSLKRSYPIPNIRIDNLQPYQAVRNWDYDALQSAKKNGPAGVNDSAKIVNRFATRAKIQNLSLRNYRNPVLLPVYTDDIFVSGNTLPTTLAAKINQDTGIPISTDIIPSEACWENSYILS